MERRVQSLKKFIEEQKSMDYIAYVSEDSEEIDEKSVSIAQQRLFGMAWAVRSGAMKREDVPASVLSIVDSNMTDEQIKDFAKTSHTGLPMHKEAKTNEGMSASNDKFFMEDLANYFDQGDSEFTLKIHTLKKTSSGWVIAYELDVK